MSLFYFREAPFSGLKLTSVHLVKFKSSTFLKIKAIFGEKESGTSAVTAVIYVGTSH